MIQTHSVTPQLLDRALGAYLGLAIGDALGATVEFMTPREIVATYGVHRHMVGGGWLKLKPGTVTDDTTMALALGDAMVASRGWNLQAIGDSYVSWLRSMPVDCGNTCRRGIRRYMLEGTLQGPFNEGDAGNGAAMRNLPVVLGFLHSDDCLREYSLEQARLTHNHPLSDRATVALARMVSTLLKGGSMHDIQRQVGQLASEEPRFSIARYKGRASAYVVDTLQTVLHDFLAHDSFEDCVVSVVNRGDDADTTGALAGMLAGARHGTRALPRHWVRKLDPDIRHRIEVQVRQLLTLQARLAAEAGNDAQAGAGRAAELYGVPP